MTNKMAYLPKPESGTKCPKTSTPRNNSLVRTTASESLEIICFEAFMVFRVVTLGVVVRKQKISSCNIFQEHGQPYHGKIAEYA